MRKQWMAMLSVLGLTMPAVRVESQQATATPAPKATRTEPPKNSNSQGILVSSDRAKRSVGQAGPGGKLQVNQQTLRQQNQGGVQQGTTQTTTDANNKVQKVQGAGRQGDPLATIDGLNKGQKSSKLNVKQQSLRQQNQGAGRQGDPEATLTDLNKGKGADLSRTCGNNQLTKAKVQGVGQTGAGGGTKVGGNQALTKAGVQGTNVPGGDGPGTKNSKLNLNQQNLRQQNQAGRNAAQTTAGKNAGRTTVNATAQTTVQTTQNNAVPK